MPLLFEVWDERRSAWTEGSQLIAGERPASISSTSVVGGRQVHHFECALDDTHSTISVFSPGVDAEAGERRVANGDVVKLRDIADGEEYEMKIHTDRSLVPRKMRVRHVKIDFGTRHCLLCEQEIPAYRLGRHMQGEHPEGVGQWPGGAPAYFGFMRRSMSESIKAAKGFPRVQERLRRERAFIVDLEKAAKQAARRANAQNN